MWVDERGFTLSENKTSVMFITRHRIQCPDIIHTNTYNIKTVDFYKYLGIIIDRKLLWTRHVEYVRTKCEKGINVLRHVTNSKWGADVKVALLFYKSYIRPIIDYGAIFYGSTSTTNRQKIRSIQLRALRVCLGAMTSSPGQIVFSEAQELPFELRIVYLAHKQLLKIRSHSEPIFNRIFHLFTETLSNKYWANRNSPPLTEDLLFIKNYESVLLYSARPPIFNVPYFAWLTKFNVIIPRDIDTQNAKVRTLELLAHYQNYIRIYTDGSKGTNGVGCAFYVMDTQYSEAYKLVNTASIFTAELTAILYALKWVLDKKLERTVILSDSCSALKLMQNFEPKNNVNELLSEIVGLHHYMSGTWKVIAYHLYPTSYPKELLELK